MMFRKVGRVDLYLMLNAATLVRISGPGCLGSNMLSMGLPTFAMYTIHRETDAALSRRASLERPARACPEPENHHL
jgi:hypothetical protein